MEHAVDVAYLGVKLLICDVATKDRLPFQQAPGYERERTRGGLPTSVYRTDRCCVCYRPVAAGAPLVRLTRDDTGDWYAVPNRAPASDEQTYGHFTLPIGPDCLRRRPELRPYLAAAPIEHQAA